MLNKGDEINNYTLERYLGKGSYGEVWLAKRKIELSDDGILVALKFLAYQPQKGKTQENFIKQVRREVGTWIRASGHKNIVPVQDGFAFREDAFVIVSDFAEGGSLSDWLEENDGKSPSLEKTVEIMSEILDGLTHLHSQSPEKIIHRDLKPDNVLFKSGVPCITDFGVSRMSQTLTKSMLQVAATSAGTPLYMSPESFNKQPVSRSMDIWSAGVILYQMLSGNLPYYDDNLYLLALEISQGKPPKPLPENIPVEFQAVVAKSLATDVSQRFQTAEEIKADLKTALKVWRKTQEEIETEAQRQRKKEEQERLEAERLQHKKEEKERQQKINDTIIDDNFNKTELLKIPVTDDWQAIEAENQRQREAKQARLEAEKLQHEKEEQQKVERERLQREAEAKRFKQEKEENLRKQKYERKFPKDAKDTFIPNEETERVLNHVQYWIVGIGGGVIGIILLLIWMNSDSTVSTSNSNFASNIINKPPNVASNNTNSVNKAANTASSLIGEMFKNSIGMEFVRIPSGSFMMGSPSDEKDRSDDEGPQHQVTISKDFYMGKYEVTQAEYEKVMGTNPSNFKNCPRCPVEQVSWEDAQAFIKKLNAKNEGTYSLPTEAEWEYAARAGTTTPFGIGDGNNLSSNEANFDGNYPYGNASKGKYLQKTTEVGSYQPNKWGLYNMHGNVWEWCEDIYQNRYNGLPVDGSSNLSKSDSSSRVLRGGSWGSFGSYLRSTERDGGSPSIRSNGNGFRVAFRPSAL